MYLYLSMLNPNDWLMYWILLDEDVELYRRNFSRRLDRLLMIFERKHKIIEKNFLLSLFTWANDFWLVLVIVEMNLYVFDKLTNVLLKFEQYLPRKTPKSSISDIWREQTFNFSRWSNCFCWTSQIVSFRWTTL